LLAARRSFWTAIDGICSSLERVAGLAMRHSFSLAVFVFTLTGCEVVAGYEPFRRYRDGGADPTCNAERRPQTKGAAMRRVNAGTRCFWMDETEVTQDQYARFLLDNRPPNELEECRDNATLVPAGMGDAGETCEPDFIEPVLGPDYPVVCIDWCDASSYCNWAGKELCNDDAEAWDSPTRSDWYAACSNAGKTEYAWGSDWRPKACNGADSLTFDGAFSVGASRAGSMRSCHNDDGIYDLTGNVQEWTQACSDNTDCSVRGGSFQSSADNLRCAVTRPAKRADRDPTVGFRCCAYP
jgi:formylglycine-generating enzyme